ncbi:MAG: SpoIIE family protein phosphatase [Eubacteriales bacterium]|nr:SpoIIE family protein phosphatase [Eubacteriales bacterium]
MNDLKTARRRLGRAAERLRRLRRLHFTREAALAAASWFTGAVLLFPASLAVLGSGMSPFAPALFSAGLAAGLHPCSMLLGCAAAIPVGPFSPEAVAPAVACLAVWGAALAVRLLFSLEPADREGRELRMAACAAIGALLPSLVMARGIPYNLLSACAGAVIASAAAPALYPALLLRAGRQRLLPDERIALFGCAAVAMLGCAALPGLFGRLPLLLADLILLLFAGSGAASGALGGACVSVALAACGYDPLFCAYLALGGALAGLLGSLSRPASAGGLILSAAVCAVWRFGPEQALPEVACALLAGCAYCFLPEGLLACLQRPTDGLRESERRALQRQRSDLRRKIDALADVFSDLSGGYAQAGSVLPSESEMVAQLREKLCAGCPSYTACWTEDGSAAGRLLCQLLGLTFSGALIGEESELPPELGRQCRRAGQIPRRVGALLADYDARRRAELKRERLAGLMAAQFDQARALLSAAGRQIESGAQPEPHLAAIARAALEKEGVRAEYVYAIGGEQPQICARLTAKAELSSLRRAAELIGEETGENYELSAHSERQLCFSPLPRLRLQVGFRSVPGNEACPNGDNRLTIRLADGRALLALSDGMGSGERAGQESADTLRLISRFLQAGVEPCAAIEAINELMLLRSGEDMYSTVDLCLIDPSGSVAELIKLGACRSYLVRGEACVRLEGGRLPLGILEEVRPAKRSLSISRGDLLIMATDGLECGDEDEWIVQLLREMRRESAQKIADALVEAALQRPRAHSDDTTVLAVRVA